MKKSVTKNYIYNLAYQILIIILPIITTPYISRVLGVENIGIYSYTLSISAFFILFGSLGVALYGKREIAYLQKDKKQYTIAFWEILILRIITMTISLIIFGLTFARNGEYQVYFRILILEIVANCIDISWLFQGLEEFKKTVIRNMLVKLISVVCIFVFVKTRQDLTKYFIIYVLSIFIGNGSLWFYLPRFLVKVRIKELNVKKHFKPTFNLFLPQIAVEVYTILDRTMIGLIINDKSEVGFYDQSQKIIKMLLTVITALGTVMLPRIANNFANGKKKKINKYMKKSFNMVFFLSFPMIFGIISVSAIFVPKFFGEGYEKVAILMNVISPIILFIGLSNVIGTQYLLPTKRQKEFTISVVCGAVINFIINMSLIWNYGAIGASIGTVIAEFAVTVIQIYFVRKDFNILKIIKSARNYLLASGIMFVVCLIINNIVRKPYFSMALQVAIGGIVYLTILIILEDKFVFGIIDRIRKKVKIKGII